MGSYPNKLKIEKYYFTKEQILKHLEENPALWLTSRRSLEDYRDNHCQPETFLDELTDRVNICVEWLDKCTQPLKNPPRYHRGSSYKLKHCVEEYIQLTQEGVSYWTPVGAMTLAASLYSLRVIGLSNYPQSRNATICCKELEWRSRYTPPKTQRKLNLWLTEEDHLDMELRDSSMWNPVNDGDCPGFAGD